MVARVLVLLFLVCEGVLAVPRVDAALLQGNRAELQRQMDGLDVSRLTQEQLDALVEISKIPSGSLVLGALAKHFRFHKRITMGAIIQVLTPIIGPNRAANLQKKIDLIARGFIGCKEPTQFRNESGACAECRGPCVVGAEIVVSECTAFEDRLCRTICEGAPGRTGGQYLSNGKCESCASCSEGLGVIVGCDGLNNRRCEVCPHGQDARGDVLQCTTCPSGQFQPTQGSPCQPCDTTACSAGTGLKSLCSATTNKVCAICQVGMEYLSGGACVPCFSCPPGQAPSATTPDKCPRDASQCEACPAGKASVGGNEECTDCESGFYATIQGSSTCRACPTTCGPTSRSTQQCGGIKDLGCQPCAEGQYVKDNICVPCSSGAGRYHLNPDGSCDECAACPKGFENICVNNREETCIACRNGKYSADGISCAECYEMPNPAGQSGRYSADPTSCSGCTPCGNGYRMVRECTATTDRVCEVCPAGKHAGPTDVECQDCLPGTGSDAGASTCTDCDEGTFSSGGQPCRSYTAATPGSRVKTAGSKTADNILECDKGYYKGPSGDCSECPAGWFKEAVGDDTCCQPCRECIGGQETTSCSSSRNRKCQDADSTLATGSMMTSAALIVLLLLTLLPATKWLTPARGVKKSGVLMGQKIGVIVCMVISLVLALVVVSRTSNEGVAVGLATTSAVFFLVAMVLSVSISKGGSLFGFNCQAGEFIVETKSQDHFEPKLSCADCFYNEDRLCSEASPALETQPCTGETRSDTSKCICPAGKGVDPIEYPNHVDFVGSLALNQLLVDQKKLDYLCTACPENTYSQQDEDNWFNICQKCEPDEYSLSGASECAKCGSYGAFLQAAKDEEALECPMEAYDKAELKQKLIEKCAALQSQGVDPENVAKSDGTDPVVSCVCKKGLKQTTTATKADICEECPVNQELGETGCEDCKEGTFSMGAKTDYKCVPCGTFGTVSLHKFARSVESKPEAKPFADCPQRWLLESLKHPNPFPAKVCSKGEGDLHPNDHVDAILSGQYSIESVEYDCVCSSDEEFTPQPDLYPLLADDSAPCKKKVLSQATSIGAQQAQGQSVVNGPISSSG